jgi:hypothetical protein
MSGEYSGSISTTKTSTNTVEYNAPSQNIPVPPHSYVEVEAIFTIRHVTGTYSFDAIIGGDALVSYTASCNGKSYNRFSTGPIDGFLYYRKAENLPEGLAFIKNESGIEKLSIHSGGTLKADSGTDYSVYIYPAQPLDSLNTAKNKRNASLKPVRVIKGTIKPVNTTSSTDSKSSSMVKPSDINTIFKK